MRARAKRCLPAFTLIELLVVISVIAVLMGILLPALASSREASRRLKCLTNLKGMGMGIQVYMNDKGKGIFPKVRPLQGDNAKQDDPGLLDLLADYIDAPTPRKEGDIFIVADPYKCPSDNLVTSDKDGNMVRPLHETNGTSYNYVPGEFMIFSEIFLGVPADRVAFAVTKTYEKWSMQGRLWPVMADHGDRHKGRRSGPMQNGVFLPEWRADWLEQPLESDVATFFGDIKKFAGM